MSEYPIPKEDCYVAWLRWSGSGSHRHLVLCDSDAEGAFKVYRYSSVGAAAWRPITATDLPSIGDEIFAHSIFQDKQWDTVSSVTKVHAEWRVDDFLNCGWTHFRPINAPKQI